jgi:hypothetical protein
MPAPTRENQHRSPQIWGLLLKPATPAGSNPATRRPGMRTAQPSVRTHEPPESRHHGDQGRQRVRIGAAACRSFIQALRGRPRLARARLTEASHFLAVLMETPCFLTTAARESVRFSPSGTGRRGLSAGFGGMDSRLRAAQAAGVLTPFSLPTWASPRAQSSALTVSHAMYFGPVFPMIVL